MVFNARRIGHQESIDAAFDALITIAATSVATSHSTFYSLYCTVSYPQTNYDYSIVVKTSTECTKPCVMGLGR